MGNLCLFIDRPENNSRFLQADNENSSFAILRPIGQNVLFFDFGRVR